MKYSLNNRILSEEREGKESGALFYTLEVFHQFIANKTFHRSSLHRFLHQTACCVLNFK